ncbi:rit1 DUSP-like domain-containing protein [Hirsutella rhossiliensis]|uniref:Rit1 DUSP-like domain-containing protein n=1 Tax=Hirsutella rhossiliensis TaxID=111463 RepID=A0A9P8N1L3_9HYPO|nr:rit1 DUSP-like domain-containing protein [Hirsutella rhossiliensis]KAH0965252.1 rit1 DUSP-like domain-containing protein [Hirsutella rhossiliensis]
MSSAPYPDPTALIFPHQPSLSSLLSSLRRSTLSLHNRLASIRADAAFVARAASAFSRPGAHDDGDAGSASFNAGRNNCSSGRRPRPLVANERCGSWYMPPDRKAASAYFKSTDGHERAWKFSTRRLNLHLVDMIEDNDGVIIVDSTRRGKRMPDALSTTIPIWCTVVNLALLPSHPLSPNLFLPPHLPPSTHAQVSALIPGFLASLRALDLDLLPRCRLSKPLRPLWVTPDSTLDPDPGPDADGSLFDDYRPVICCTASRAVRGSEMDEGGYVQGAADDAENWSCGLTPTLFWDHVDELLAAPEAELSDMIASLVSQRESARKDGMAASSSPALSRKSLTSYLSVCPLPLHTPTAPNTCHIALTSAASTPQDSWTRSPTHMEVGLGRHKTASRNLRLALPEICAFAARFLDKGTPSEPTAQVVVACDSGKDVSVGAALALSCYLFDEHGAFRVPGEGLSFTKALVKARLGAIMSAFPEANPSRQTLQSVNSFLMDWRK